MNVRLKYTTVFTAGVYYNDQLIMNNYRAVFKLLTGDCNSEDHNTAMERLKFFIHNQLSSGIFINQSNAKTCQTLLNSKIKVVTLPEEPIDQVVGIMLYSKLNAVMEDRMFVTDVELSSELGDNVCYLHSDDENQGPLDQLGWWQNSDSGYFNSTIIVDQKIVDLHQNYTWKELDLEWSDNQPTKQDNKLVFADFKKDETR
jgi:hypothetical protein